jgi:hypothetical protein
MNNFSQNLVKSILSTLSECENEVGKSKALLESIVSVLLGGHLISNEPTAHHCNNIRI